MPAEGLCLRVTHTGLARASLPLNDINDGVGRDTGDDRFRRSGPAYVPYSDQTGPGSIELVYTSDVAKSFEIGTIRKYIEGGHLIAEFIIGAALLPLLGQPVEVLDEGVQLTPSASSLDFTGAGVTATNVGDAVTVNIPGGGAGGGNVTAAANLTDNALVRGDGGGFGIQDSSIIIDDTDNLTFPGGATLSVDTVAEATAGNGVVVNGIRNYGKSAANPAAPAPADGDTYYNTVLRMQMTYDGFRGKWLSVEAESLHFGRDGNTRAGQFYRAADGRVMSSTLGWYTERSGTVVSLTYTRTDADAATFEIVADGVAVAAVASAATKGRDISLNADFTFGQILAVLNQAGGNTTSNVIAKIRVRWRA